MELWQLLSVMKPYDVVIIRDIHRYDVYYGEVGNASVVIPSLYMQGVVSEVYPEYAHGWGKTGIAITVSKEDA